MRFLFDNAADAGTYQRERLLWLRTVLCSGIPGPSVQATRSMMMFCYVFRIGSAIVKLFVAEGSSANESLTPGPLFPIAKRIAERIRIAFTASGQR